LPNYQVWVKDVNDAGGINVGGKKLKVEVIEYDDRSNSEEMIKAVERLATQDKVDFILPPWSTGMNLAAAPIFNKLGYPQLAVTANTNQAPELTKRWPNLTSGSVCPQRSSTASSKLSPSSRKTARSTRRSR
jgi:branched-chain amino acid transport system substrate-binding protein